MKFSMLAAAAAGGLVAMTLAAPASAHHNDPQLMVDDPGECGETTFRTSWALDEHQVDNTMLVVRVGDEISSVAVGDAITAGPFEAESVTIQYRIWGGGERDYDDPALTDLDALVDYLDADESHTPLDAGAPGIGWHELTVYGCPPDDGDEQGTGPTTPPAGDDGEGGEELPETGVRTGTLALGAVALVVVGGALYLVARRRTSFTA